MFCSGLRLVLGAVLSDTEHGDTMRAEDKQVTVPAGTALLIKLNKARARAIGQPQVQRLIAGRLERQRRAQSMHRQQQLKSSTERYEDVPLKKTTLLTTILAVLAIPAFAGLFEPKGDDIEQKRATVRKERDEILTKLYASQPEAKAKIENQLGLFIYVAIASEMPAVGSKGQ
jgi:hypothetical protein